MPAFDTWSQENLAKFAAEAYAKMQEQDDRIQQLQNDLKTLRKRLGANWRRRQLCVKFRGLGKRLSLMTLHPSLPVEIC